MKTAAPTSIGSEKQVHRPSRQIIAKGKAQRRGKWSPAEIEILREHYPVTGAQGCLKYLPKRTRSAIATRAQILDIKFHHHKPWIPEEISILKEKYPQGGTSECVKLLTGRTPKSIRAKASEMLLTSPRQMHEQWSSAEIATLRKYYPSGGTEGCLKYLPNRTRAAIMAGAQKLNIKYDKLKPWTPEEISILKEKYSQGGASECAKLLPKRTPNTIRVNARKISLLRNRPWSDPEIDILLKNYPAGGIKACIQLLPHRSRQTIRQRCYLLGIQRT
ncbi:hypothetical protein [Acetobacter peroxydans]|uniref:hypothetical protein n=1 Tax=Acetobacter peroxydans TaxID=104098 RepID=UPI00114278FB|nr:hypothetical protein [Acetobacter peroxydans]NHO17353.1 hypothetical protein [Acetobacter peroxydans]